MANLYNGPPRGGTRGGKDQFNWDNIKNDKDKTYYLGHSIKALSGRWQNNKDVYWWTKGKAEDANAMQTELEAVKEREAELMAEALGLQPKKRKVAQQPQLSPAELAELMRKARGEGEEEPAVPGEEADRVKGLGYRPGPAMAGGVAQHEVMAGEGLEPAEGQNGGGAAQALPPPPPRRPTEQQLALMVAQAKAEKRAKKAAKKAKKLAKSIAKADKKEKRKKEKHKRRDASLDGDSAKIQPAAASSQGEDSSGPSDVIDERDPPRDDKRSRPAPEAAREPHRSHAEQGRDGRAGRDMPSEYGDIGRERDDGRPSRRRDGSPSRQEDHRRRRRSRTRSPEHRRRR